MTLTASIIVAIIAGAITVVVIARALNKRTIVSGWWFQILQRHYISDNGISP
jgi:hypothetical protein